MNEALLIAIRNELEEWRGEDLWNVLSALRGPDAEDNHELKLATTGVIRYHFLGKTRGSMHGSTVLPDTEEAAKLRRQYTNVWSHFISHAKDAFEALGLKWDEVNK